MADIPLHGWTKPLPTANTRADPSGVQDAGTWLQAQLLSGMSTITPRIRYISLFTGAQYCRHQAHESGRKLMGFKAFLRRFEALIALSSVAHHTQWNDTPNNIVGRTTADKEILKDNPELKPGVKNHPYNIYRGTLDALGLFDLTTTDDPLRESARPLGKSWDISVAGFLGKQIMEGKLPETVKRTDLDAIASAFCLCQVPCGSKEQQCLIDLLFGLDKKIKAPDYNEAPNYRGMRIASWRLLLEIIDKSPGRNLANQYLMSRILEPAILEIQLNPTLYATLLLWRWVAARSFFEIGWTVAFNWAFEAVRQETAGITHDALLDKIHKQYLDSHKSESLLELSKETERQNHSISWVSSCFTNKTFRNCILMMIYGATVSGEDLERSQMRLLRKIDVGQDHPIPFQKERERLHQRIVGDDSAAGYWAEVAIDSLLHHVKISLERMARRAPDSLHVEYEEGLWQVPPGRDGWEPRSATESSRLDIALGWLEQLGLIMRHDGSSYSLTEVGEATRNRWDEVYASWG